MTLPRELRSALRRGEEAHARQLLREHLERSPDPVEPLAVARAASELGELKVARNVLEAGVRRRPDDAVLREELAELLEDIGEEDLAMQVRSGEASGSKEESGIGDSARRAAVGRDVTPSALPGAAFHDAAEAADAVADAVAEAARPGEIPPFDDVDLVRMHQLFGGREDVHARQWVDPDRGSGYAPIHKPLTPDLLRAHLHGTLTLGVYPIRLDATVTFVALDLDITKRAMEAALGHREATRALREKVHEAGLTLRAEAQALGVPGALFDSGYKGRHLWIFLREPVPARLAHRFGNALAARLAPQDAELVLEVFPRQAQVRGKGLGNLIKIPLGIHQFSGRRAALLDAEGLPMARPFATLHGQPRLERERLLDLLAELGPGVAHGTGRPAQSAERREHAGPAVQAAPAPPPFTEADFEARAQVVTLLRGCAVLRELVERGLQERRLDHDERIVLRHAMGHLEDGREAANYVFARCPEIPPDAFLGKRLSGSPISCARVRQRVPAITSRVPCNCAFPERPDHYPSPVLHAEGVAPHVRAESAPDPEALARTWVALQERRRRVEAECQGLGRHLIETLRRLPDRRIAAQGGMWVLRDDEGLPVVEWEAEQEAPGGAGAEDGGDVRRAADDAAEGAEPVDDAAEGADDGADFGDGERGDQEGS